MKIIENKWKIMASIMKWNNNENKWEERMRINEKENMKIINDNEIMKENIEENEIM